MSSGGRRIVHTTSAGALAVAVAAGALHLGTLQAAYSPLALALPSGPFAQLEQQAWWLGIGGFVAAAGHAEPSRGEAAAFVVGTALKLGVLAIAASTGMMAVQASDPRSLTLPLFVVRTLANLALLVFLAAALRRRLSPRPAAA